MYTATGTSVGLFSSKPQKLSEKSPEKNECVFRAGSARALSRHMLAIDALKISRRPACLHPPQPPGTFHCAWRETRHRGQCWMVLWRLASNAG